MGNKRGADRKKESGMSRGVVRLKSISGMR